MHLVLTVEVDKKERSGKKRQADIYKCNLPFHPLMPRRSSQIVICIFDNFDNNFVIKTDFTKYLKERCGHSSD